MIPALKKQLIAEWGSLGTGLPAPAALSVLGIRGSIRSGRATFLVFAGGREPAFTLKLLRNPAKREQFDNEETTLIALRDVPSIARKVPRVVKSGVLGGVRYLLETYLSGRTMNAELGRDGLPAPGPTASLFGAVREWLIALARETDAGNSARNPQLESEILLRPFTEYEEIFEPRGAEKELLYSARAALASSALPLRRAHGDFCRQNILMAGGRISGVIDWELSRAAEAPLFDLFTFLVNFHLFAGGGGKDFSHCFRRTFFEDNHYSRAARGLAADCAEALGAPRGALRPLLALAAAKEAAAEYRVLDQSAARGFIPWAGESTDLDPRASYSELFREQLWRKLFRFLAENINVLVF